MTARRIGLSMTPNHDMNEGKSPLEAYIRTKLDHAYAVAATSQMLGWDVPIIDRNPFPRMLRGWRFWR